MDSAARATGAGVTRRLEGREAIVHAGTDESASSVGESPAKADLGAVGAALEDDRSVLVVRLCN